MTLHTTTVGSGPVRLAFLHGLFGQGKNLRTVAQGLSKQATCLLIDAPNHGRSEHTPSFSYALFADMVAETLREWSPDEPVVLCGHSMGGKIAMRVALQYPDLLDRLIVMDIAPATHSHGPQFEAYLDQMAKIDLAHLENRAQADEVLAETIPEQRIRSFLLQSLHRDPDSPNGWRWLLNLSLLRRSMSALASWPTDIAEPWRGEVLWIVGELSSLDQKSHLYDMERYFPHTSVVIVYDAGHWVHADEPAKVIDAIAEFIRR